MCVYIHKYILHYTYYHAARSSMYAGLLLELCTAKSGVTREMEIICGEIAGLLVLNSRTSRLIVQIMSNVKCKWYGCELFSTDTPWWMQDTIELIVRKQQSRFWKWCQASLCCLYNISEQQWFHGILESHFHTRWVDFRLSQMNQFIVIVNLCY